MSGRFPRLLRLSARALAGYAQRAKRRENWSQAARCYRTAVACDPASPAIWVQYGNALKECGALLKAEAAYRRALTFAPDDADAYLQLGHVLKLQNRGDDSSAAYQTAVSLDPLLHEASLELLAYGSGAHVARSDVPAQRAVDGLPQRQLFVFDASDLLNHIPYFRSVTGIQRVQLNIIASLIRCPDPDVDLAVAWFDQTRGYWLTVAQDFFLQLSQLTESSDPMDDTAWRKCVRQLIAIRVHGTPVRFRHGAQLLNLGTSWGLANYFLRVRVLKARYGVRYLAFVHDCIPAFFPRFCAADTVRDYLDWAAGVFDHADGFFANSSTTAKDLARLAALLGGAPEPTKIVRLDARFRDDVGQVAEPIAEIIKRHNLDRCPYVLLVSSLEPRKNHISAFRAWLELIHRRGRRNTPLLICVASRSWMASEATALLRSRRELSSSVRILTGVADGELSALYHHCLFTIYPSLYEGWGLPVTEALCHGKVPLIAAIPPLREAGGDFAEYFQPHDHDHLVARLERLIDDAAYRSGREANIRSDFKPRTWRDLGQDILDHAHALAERPARPWEGNQARAGGSLLIPPVALGEYYRVARNTETQLRCEMRAGEVHRVGEGWWAPEAWGCWLKPGSAEIAFRLPPDASGDLWFHLALRGNPSVSAKVVVAAAVPVATTAMVCAGQFAWVSVRLPTCAVRGGIVRILITANESCSLAELAGGIDRRDVSIGVRGFSLTTESTADSIGTQLDANRV